jgi:Dolichyl-phosphate-mannose-protein mannosyltransferase
MLTKKATINLPGSLHSTTLTIVISFILIYLATITADYYWDGVTFALQIEKVARMERGAALLFHQNHLLYNALAYLPYCLLQASGLAVRALYLSQVANAFAGAAAVAVFFRMAERLTRSRYAAIVSTAALAFSAVWWKLATDANAYMLSILLILICAVALLSARPRWLLAGLAFAGAMLIHQLASLFYPAALVAVFTNPRIEKKWPFAVKLSALAWGITVAAYTLCASLLHSVNEPLALIKWAVSNPSGVAPSANPLHGLKLLPRGNLDMIVGHNFALYASQGGSIARLLALAALIAAICFLLKFLRIATMAEVISGFIRIAPQTRERLKTVAPMLVTWIGAYIVFLLFWEPWQVLYRAFYLPPLALLFGLALSNYHHATNAMPTGAAALAVATLALFNLAFYIAPNMRADANPLVAAARNTHQIWNGKTVIYFSDRSEADTTFEYFNEQTEWRRLTATVRSGIDDEIQQANGQGGQVWLNKGAAESVDFDWLARRARGRTITLESPGAPARYVELLPAQ